MKLGAVSYSNARPLLEGLGGRVSLETRPPSGVARALREGSIDAGLVPVIALARQPDLVALGDCCIGSEGPVDSVLLRLRKPPQAVRTLALDPHSRSSQVLAQLVLDGAHGVRPEVLERDPAVAWQDEAADAVLVIGDPALQLPEPEVGEQRLDLALAWREMTGHPFVFAVWAGRREAIENASGLEQLLSEARDAGLARIEEIARSEAAITGLSAERMSVYLRTCIRYRLGPRERAGLEAFLGLARERGLV